MNWRSWRVMSSLLPESMGNEFTRPFSHFSISLSQFFTRLLGQTMMQRFRVGLASGDWR
jgi:hypothetical protein